MKHRLYIYSFVALSIVYLWMIFALPTDPKILEQYHITQTQVRWINSTLAIPVVVVWLFALYGFLQFKKYAGAIDDSREGKPFNQLASGLWVLALSLPISSISSTFLRYLAFKNPELMAETTIARNYITLLVSMVAFFLIARGAENLVKTLHTKPVIPHPPHLTIGAIMLASLFTWFIIARPEDGGTNQAIYYLPDWLLIFTLVIPYLLVWYKGSMAAHRLYLYRDKVRGTVYKKAFENLAQGIGVIVGLSVLIQFITTLSAQLAQLDLTPLLLFIYVLVGLYAIGYGLVARGAKRLKKIEEV